MGWGGEGGLFALSAWDFHYRRQREKETQDPVLFLRLLLCCVTLGRVLPSLSLSLSAALSSRLEAVRLRPH